MTNMLRVIEVANGSTFGTAVKWPVKRGMSFNARNHEDLQATIDALSANNISFRVYVRPGGGTNLTVIIRDKYELNAFAEVYFPHIFKVGLEDALAQDKNIRRPFGDMIRRIPRPTPNIIIANKKIDEVRRRLAQFGINA